jgi:type II secretory pathway component PulJ
MKQNRKIIYCSGRLGFTLAEVIATLVIAAMIMIAAIGIYTGIRQTEAAINRRLESGFLTTEILQRVAEDIDRLAMPGSDVTMSIRNKTEDGGYKSAQMIVESKIYDKDNKPQTFEKIIWQSRGDQDANGLVIYRAHGGYTLEDKMLDADGQKEKYEREKFIPICSGATLFSIEAVIDDNTVQTWESRDLPQGIKISISFTKPQQDVMGNLVIPQEAVKTRTITINRFRQLVYQFIYRDFDINEVNDINDQNMPPEPNEFTQPQEPNKIVRMNE